MKRILIAAALFATAIAANATEYVVSANQATVHGVEDMVMVERDTASGNRVKVTYAGSGSPQYIADDGAFSVYSRIVARLGAKAVAVPGSPTGAYVNAAKAATIQCYNGGSLITVTGLNNSLQLADGCQFWQNARASAN